MSTRRRLRSLNNNSNTNNRNELNIEQEREISLSDGKKCIVSISSLSDEDVSTPSIPNNINNSNTSKPSSKPNSKPNSNSNLSIVDDSEPTLVHFIDDDDDNIISFNNNNNISSNRNRPRSINKINQETFLSLFPEHGDIYENEDNEKVILRNQKNRVYKRKMHRTLQKNTEFVGHYFNYMLSLWMIEMYQGVLRIQDQKKQKEIRDAVIVGNCPQIKYFSNLLFKKTDNIEVILRPNRKLEISLIEDSSAYVIKNPITSKGNLKLKQITEAELDALSHFTGIPVLHLRAASQSLIQEEEIDPIDALLNNDIVKEKEWQYPQLDREIPIHVDIIDSIDDADYITLKLLSGREVKTHRLIIIDEFFPDELISCISNPIYLYCKIRLNNNNNIDYKIEKKVCLSPMEQAAYRFLYDKDEEPLYLDDGRCILTGSEEINEIFPLSSKLVLLTPMALPITHHPLRDFIIYLHAYILHYQ